MNARVPLGTRENIFKVNSGGVGGRVWVAESILIGIPHQKIKSNLQSSRILIVSIKYSSGHVADFSTEELCERTEDCVDQHKLNSYMSTLQVSEEKS